MDGELAGTTFRPLRLHRIYRLRVERDGDRVRLIKRGGYDWSKRYPWIVESELKNRYKQFVVENRSHPAMERAMDSFFNRESDSLRRTSRDHPVT